MSGRDKQIERYKRACIIVHGSKGTCEYEDDQYYEVYQCTHCVKLVDLLIQREMENNYNV